MSHHKGSILVKSLWTMAGLLGSYGLRFGLNIVLTRLLAPEIMGVMVIINAVRLGIELLTDVGIEQNIIHHEDGIDRHFRNVAWTMQVGRGLFLSLLFALATPFLARFYHIQPVLLYVVACSPFLGGLHSTAIFVLVRKLEVPRRNLFELASEALAFIVSVGLAYSLRSVWAPVIALVLAVAIRSALSYLLPDARQKLVLDRAIQRRIVHFGKWIALTSLLMYAASNLDRLYFGRMVPLGVVGIYGVARAFAEIPTTLARRLGYQILFPALARAKEGGDDLARQILMARRPLVLVAALGLGGASMMADWLIRLIYDPRYAAAGWMLAVLLVGGLFSILSNLNEALILAAGRPAFSSYANLARLVTLSLLLPACYALGGFSWAVAGIAAVEIAQYAYIGLGVRQIQGRIWRQDLAAMALGLIAMALIGALRLRLGLGLPFAGMMGGGRF